MFIWHIWVTRLLCRSFKIRTIEVATLLGEVKRDGKANEAYTDGSGRWLSCEDRSGDLRRCFKRI
jgi:hypothetical protein